MADLISLLKSFNRQERFFLVGAALGSPELRLGADFRHSLQNLFGLKLSDQVFVAVDYHLDWLAAAIVLANGADERIAHANDDGNIQGNQEDVDLLIAFEQDPITHILLLEAKAETSWTSEQMIAKAVRLSRIFGIDGTKYTAISPHFAVLSPKEPQKLKTGRWPVWMLKDGRPLWMELKIPKGLRVVERCDQSGRPNAEGAHFRVYQKDE